MLEADNRREVADHTRTKSALKKSNVALAESLEAHAFLESVLNASKDCIMVLDLGGAIIFMNSGGREVLEVDDLEALLGRSWFELWDGDGRGAAGAALDEARAGRASQFTASAATFKGRPKFWDVTVSCLAGVDGKPGHILSIARDITIAKDAEELREFLSRELSHRIKNSLALAQAIGLQTFRDVDKAKLRDFSGRLAALGVAQELLLQASWEAVSIRAVIENTLLPLGCADRFDIDGEDLELGAQKGLSLALAIHELGTNSLKYGALSVSGGRVRIIWSVDDGELRFSWIDRGGPPVRAPDSKGFGTRILTRNLQTDFGGEVELNYYPSGVVLSLIAPFGALDSSDPPALAF
ncbi:MAG: PAS domain-containing protein [Pseudomonadota bacterium]|nr:PAS domain-containing protein [Pseudomonadota bacterium]